MITGGSKRIEFILRPFDADDAKSVAAHANNKKIAANLRNAFPYPYTEQDAEGFINDCICKSGKKQLIRAISVKREAIGSVGVFLQDDVYARSAELGYWLSEKYWGNGIVSMAVSQIRDMAFERFDISRIYAMPFAHNEASRRVLEKAGFVLEGILRQSVTKDCKTFDSCIYAFIK